MRVVYDFHGLKLQKGIDIRECLINIFNDLGLDINFTSDRKIVANTKINIKRNIIKYVKMQPAKLININYVSGNKLIELNKNNLYIKKIIKNEQAKDIIESMINAMADSYHCLVDHQDSIDIFFSYLALKLNDEIRDIDD